MMFGKGKLTVNKSGIRISRKKLRREEFLPDDMAWIDKRLRSEQPIELGDFIAEGCSGSVFTVKGNKNVVIKVPKYYNEMEEVYHGKDFPQAKRTRRDLRIEATEVDEFGCNRAPLFAPSRIIKLPGKTPSGGDYIGILRPSVKPIMDNAKSVPSARLKKLTNGQLEEIRFNLIKLSYQGYTITDGLQIGLDRIGRPLMYDLGNITKEENPSKHMLKIIFMDNNLMWISFLCFIGKQGDVNQLLAKYGAIEYDGMSRWS